MTQAKIVEVDETWESETLSPVALAHLLPKIVNKGFTVEVEGHAFPGQAVEAVTYSKNLTVECVHRNQEHNLDGRIWCIDCGEIVRDADGTEAARDVEEQQSSEGADDNERLMLLSRVGLGEDHSIEDRLREDLDLPPRRQLREAEAAESRSPRRAAPAEQSAHRDPVVGLADEPMITPASRDDITHFYGDDCQPPHEPFDVMFPERKLNADMGMELTGKKRKRSNAERKNRKAKTS